MNFWIRVGTNGDDRHTTYLQNCPLDTAHFAIKLFGLLAAAAFVSGCDRKRNSLPRFFLQAAPRSCQKPPHSK
jgi:hypothetical protein